MPQREGFTDPLKWILLGGEKGILEGVDYEISELQNEDLVRIFKEMNYPLSQTFGFSKIRHATHLIKTLNVFHPLLSIPKP